MQVHEMIFFKKNSSKFVEIMFPEQENSCNQLSLQHTVSREAPQLASMGLKYILRPSFKASYQAFKGNLMIKMLMVMMVMMVPKETQGKRS